MLLRPIFALCLFRKNLNLTSSLNSFDTGEGTVEGMSTMATPVQPKVQVEQKKGSPVGTKMGSSPGHMHTSLCCRYSSAQFKHQPGHSCRLGSHLSSSWNKWLLTQPCWVNTRLTTHTGCPVCRLWQHRNTFHLLSHASTFTPRVQPVCPFTWCLLCGFSVCSKALHQPAFCPILIF